jgi:type I restriction enzyme S subunit
MSPAWPQVPLSDIVVPVQRPVSVNPGNTYRTLGVKWWGEGAYERQTIAGSQTAATTLNEVRTNDLIINKIWVRHGSVAVVTAEVAGCCGSNEFPTFEFRLDRIIPRWMHWYSKSRDLWAKCDSLSQGTSGKNRIRPEKFLTIPIPLPPPEDQRRIIARIEYFASKIASVLALRHESIARSAHLAASLLESALDTDSPPKTLREVVASDSKVSYGVLIPGQDVEDGVPFIRIQDLDHASPPLRPAKFIAREVDAQYPRTRLTGNEVLIAVVGATIGKIGVVPPQWAGANIARAVCRIVPGSGIRREFLIAVLRSPKCQSYFRKTTRTLAQPTLNVAQLLETPIACPELAQQDAILLRLARLQRHLDRLTTSHEATMVAMDALLPSILDRAFAGEI